MLYGGLTTVCVLIICGCVRCRMKSVTLLLSTILICVLVAGNLISIVDFVRSSGVRKFRHGKSIALPTKVVVVDKQTFRLNQQIPKKCRVAQIFQAHKMLPITVLLVHHIAYGSVNLHYGFQMFAQFT